MGNSKISVNFSTGKYTDAALSNKAYFIIENMTNNPNFVTPVPSIADLKTATDNYTAALAKAESGSKVDTVLKNDSRAALIKVLKAMAAYVQITSDGSEAIIISSGYDINKKPGTVGQLSKPTNFVVKPGANKGTVVLNCDVVEYANFYEFEYYEQTDLTDSKWIQKTSTKRKLEIDGLTSGKQYTFRVAGAGSNPARIWSEEISSFVL